MSLDDEVVVGGVSLDDEVVVGGVSRREEGGRGQKGGPPWSHDFYLKQMILLVSSALTTPHSHSSVCILDTHS